MTCFLFFLYIYLYIIPTNTGFHHFEKRSLSLVNQESQKYPTVKKKDKDKPLLTKQKTKKEKKRKKITKRHENNS